MQESTHDEDMRKAPLPQALGLLALLLSTQGCSTAPIACTAIGWSNVVEVTLSGEIEPVANVRVCVGVECEIVPPSPVPTNGNVVGPSPIVRSDGVLWRVPTSMSTDTHGRVGLFDQENRLISDQEVSLAWQQDGGTTTCGGPSTAVVAVSV